MIKELHYKYLMPNDISLLKTALFGNTTRVNLIY
jgi:hypothetical protein